ncbi:membrane protein [methanotrophic bacterial endosymbiont of Bathymodiolus sp.]|nr:membrane protein [methanotrophic bacterial endosymbiont of Bathymodiolus sp.]
MISTLPEIRALTVSHRLTFLDLDTEANLPTNYSILKLYFSAIISVLMVFWYKGRAPVFWKIAAIALFITGLDWAR